MKQNENNLLNVSSAVREYFGLPVYHPSDPLIKDWLETNRFRSVIVFLIDALGARLLQYHLPSDAFLRRHMKQEIPTVFPPTTAAATTSFLTGKSPAETGWLGWDQYFKEVDDEVILFYGTGIYSGREYGRTFAYDALPVEWIHEELRRSGIRAESVWPAFGSEHPSKTFDELLENGRRIADDPETSFIYMYWDAFDDLCHKEGPWSSSAGESVKTMNDRLEQWRESLPKDSGVLVLADHGQTAVTPADLRENPELLDCLAHLPTLEGRAAAMHVKPGMHSLFAERFHAAFGDSFRLLRKEEVLNSHLFGPGEPHARTAEFIGDYLAVGTGHLRLACTDKQMLAAGDHAGLTDEERMIPNILFEGKQ